MQEAVTVLEPARHTVRRTQEERALVTRAKEALMSQCGWTEDQAHRFLQKRSMDHGSRLPDTARKVLEELSPGVRH